MFNLLFLVINQPINFFFIPTALFCQLGRDFLCRFFGFPLVLDGSLQLVFRPSFMSILRFAVHDQCEFAARRLGLVHWSISLTHSRTDATAVVIAGKAGRSGT